LKPLSKAKNISFTNHGLVKTSHTDLFPKTTGMERKSKMKPGVQGSTRNAGSCHYVGFRLNLMKEWLGII
jgi:hypothetical protein